MTSTLYYPFSGVVGAILTLWLLSLGVIAAKRKKRHVAAGFLCTAPAVAISAWALIQASPSWRQEPEQLSVRAHYSVLGAVLVILTTVLVYYVIARLDHELVGPSGATWMLPATGAAWLATAAMLLDVTTYHMQHSLPWLLSVICGALALSLVALTAINAAQAWGNHRHGAAK